jgi:tetratricopeptide (TPR) repeat protein
LTQAQLSRTENGPAVTDLAKLIPIAHTLGIPADLLWFKLPKDRPSKPARPAISIRSQDGSVAEATANTDENISQAIGQSAPDITNEEDDMQRRQLLHGILAGASSALPASALANLVQLEQVRQSLDRLFEGSAIGTSTLERWDALPGEYGQRYQTVAPGQLLTDVASDFVELQYLLGQRQATKGRVTLCRASSQLATLAGIFLAAQGDKRSAQNWFYTAGLAASEAGDRQLAGLALVRSGIVFLYHGAPERALAKLAKAQFLLGTNPTSWRARALVVEARAQAKLGKANEAKQALIQAETTFQNMSATALRDPALGYTERQFYFTVGNAYTHLGMSDEAGQMQAQALSMYHASEYLDPALIQLDQAQCLVNQGEADSASQKAIAAITAVPLEHRGLVTHYGSSFYDQLPMPARATASGRELKELLTTRAGI